MRSRIRKRIATGVRCLRLLPAYIMLGSLKHHVILPRLARWAWQSPVGTRDHEAERTLIASVARLNVLLGRADDDCLQRSILLYHVLSRAGADPILVVGFNSNADRVRGHAWVVTDGQPIIECEINLQKFSPAFCFGSGGALLSRDFLYSLPKSGCHG